ncbi:MAG TPA: alpha/beta fold hydrolase [Sporichthyaceae bacterium]|jgi:pimeloyl-ACP methyl ester carboxylesterase|nr:alpha/beta fold hydrolase [Sporichthyaceae bacterium]
MAEVMAEINGIRMCYEDLGDPAAPPLLLIMGLGGPLIWWDDEFCQGLVDRGFRVIRFDNRDSGLSQSMPDAPMTMARLGRSMFRPDPAPAYALDDMADDAVGLLDHLGIGRAHVVGVSMGGMIAQLVTLRHPERVRSLTSMMSTTGNRRVGWMAPRILARMFAKWPPGEEAYVERSVEGVGRIGTARYFGTAALRQRDRAIRTYRRGLNPAGTMRQIAAIVAAPDRTRDLGLIRVPTVVIHGTADPLIHVSGGKATARAIPGAELVLVPGMGHDMPLELWPVLHDAIERTARRAEALRPTS